MASPAIVELSSKLWMIVFTFGGTVIISTLIALFAGTEVGR
jgi:hypothetical protein